MRPLISFVLISFNQERFIREAVEGAFSQTYTPLEIILSDDTSSDHSFKIMEELSKSYKGKHKLLLNKNANNLGIGGHINKIMELSSGELVVIAAGDDISLPARVEKIHIAYKVSGGKAISIFSNYIKIDADGKEIGIKYNKGFPDGYFLPKNIIERNSLLPGCTHAWHKNNFRIFGDIITPLTCEDMVIPFRSSLIGNIKYISEPLVKVRHHQNNIWLYDQAKNITYDVKKEIKKEMEHQRIWAYERRNIFINRLKDIQIAKKLYTTPSDDIYFLENVIRKHILSLEEDISLYNSGFFNRLRIIFFGSIRKPKISKLRNKIGVFLVPWIYKEYRYLKYKMSTLRNIT